MAAPDLTFARQTVAGLLPDHCTVTRNTGGVEDDTLDPETMQLVPPEVDPWYDGPCSIRIDPGSPEEGIGQVSLPFDPAAGADDQLQPGDVVKCTTSENPALIGQSWAVDEPIAGSFSVTRKARLTQARQ